MRLLLLVVGFTIGRRTNLIGNVYTHLTNDCTIIINYHSLVPYICFGPHCGHHQGYPIIYRVYTKEWCGFNSEYYLNRTILLCMPCLIKFIIHNLSHSTSHIGYKEKYIVENVNTKFFGLQTDNHLNCKNHTEQIIPTLSAACYAVRSMVHISNIDTLKSIYYAHFHSVIKCGIIFWGNSPNSRKFFHFTKENCESYVCCTTQNFM